MLWIVCGLLGLVIGILLTILFAHIPYQLEAENGRVRVRVGSGKLSILVYDSHGARRKSKKEPPQTEPTPASPGEKPTWVQKKRQIDQGMGIFRQERKEMISILRELSSKVHVRWIEWHIVLGFDDAAITGRAYGFVWQGVGVVTSVLKRWLHLKDVIRVEVTPDFCQHRFDTKFVLIISFRLASLIAPGRRIWKLVQKVQKIQKGGA